MLEQNENKKMAKNNKTIVDLEAITAQYKGNMNYWEYLLLAKMCAVVAEEDENYKQYSIKISELWQFADIKEADNNAQYQILEAAGKLLNRRLTVNIVANRNLYHDLETHLLTTFETLKNPQTGELSELNFTFLPMLKPVFLHLKNTFSQDYVRENISFIRTSTSSRLYHILKKYLEKGQSTVQIDLEDLKERLDVSDKYALYGHFKIRILDDAFRRLSEDTDICFEYEEVKHNRKVVAIIFHISENTPVELISDIDDFMPADLIEPTIFSEKEPVFALDYEYKVVQVFGISYAILRKIQAEYTEDAIRKAILLTEINIKNGNVLNPAGFFIEALRQNFVSSTPPSVSAPKKDTAPDPDAISRKNRDNKRKLAFEEEQERIINALRDDAILRRAAYDFLRNSDYNTLYDEDLSFADNLKNPVIYAAIHSFVKKYWE